MGKVNYLLLDMSVLPEVYVKVIEAKGYLQSGEAANASQAVKMAGISCSAYYKYKDKIFEYSEQGDDATTINAKLQDNAGVLSSVMNELYLAGANIYEDGAIMGGRGTFAAGKQVAYTYETV